MAKKKNNGELTPAEMRSIKKALLLKLAELFGDVKSMEDEALRRDSGNLSHMPIHLAELGSDNYQMEHTLGLVDSDNKLLTEIIEALIRIDKGVYGKCQNDGVPILKARLKAIPWTRFCIKCAALSEKKFISVNKKSKEQDYSYILDKGSDEEVKNIRGRFGQVINEDLLED